ncbi:GNAT family N-acetyltransferase [Candidatus Pacearchaeota archaeon]|nr:GNAT family N-acetyltransferase [Candidatus Pacearchaeota archaeon]
MDDVVLRQGKLTDASVLAKLMHEYDLYEYHLDKHCAPESLAKITKDTKRFLKTGIIKYTLIEEQGTIVALVNWRITKPGGVKTGALQNIIVTKSARGKGYGSMLVTWLFAYFKKHNCTQVSSFVRFKNKEAQRFWKSYGFDFSEQGYHITKRL